MVLGLLAAATAASQELQLLDFTLEDQFKRIHRRADFSGNIILLIGSDKGGVEFNGAWEEAIRDALADPPAWGRITHLAHADLRGVPFFLKGFIRGKFPREPHRWVLMDWKGVFPKAYGFAPKASNVLLFAPSGELVEHVWGRQPVDEAVGRLASELRALLDSPNGGFE